TGDAAVHLVLDERPQFLIAVGALGKAVVAVVVAGHYRHVLQMTVATLLAHRAIVRVIGHQEADDGLAEFAGLDIIDGHPHAVGGRRHAGHHDATGFVI